MGTPLRTVIRALSQIDEWVGPHGVPGVGAAVWSGGNVVAERYVGEARSGIPVTSETLFPLASVTKPVTAATFMALVDDGAVSLDESVGRLLPEFRAGPTAGVEGVDVALERLRPTIGARQLLCHVAGLPEDLGPRE
jgi:CubicO group peptidase (beta-lactamase class C family)